MSADLPAPPRPPALDRGAVERVLARAAELQVARAGGDEGLSEADLLAAAREAGIGPEHVRLALAEERLRAARRGPAAEPPRGLAARVAGPAVVAAERVVAGPAARALDVLGGWLEREECMRLVRRTGAPAAGAQAAWEPRRDVLGNLARGLRGGGSQALRRVPLLSAVALPAGGGPADEERVLLRVEADLAPARRQRLAVGAVVAGSGAAAGGSILGVGVVAHAVMAVVAPLAVIPLLAGGAAAWALGRGHRAAAERTQAALEQLLDRAEAAGAVGALPPPAPAARGAALLDALDGVRRALR
jgi:hypothetical protein